RASVPLFPYTTLFRSLLFLGYAYLVALAAAEGYEWVTAGSDAVDMYVRLVLWSIAALVVVCAVPILAKWTLIGRWKAGPIRIWRDRKSTRLNSSHDQI